MNADIKVKHLDEKYVMKVNIKITKQFKVRMWIATQLIYLAGKILKCGIEINEIL